ncbi:MAG: hypothetical protein ACK5LT_05225 [Lachnospirales bacterium]
MYYEKKYFMSKKNKFLFFILGIIIIVFFITVVHPFNFNIKLNKYVTTEYKDIYTLDNNKKNKIMFYNLNEQKMYLTVSNEKGYIIIKDRLIDKNSNTRIEDIDNYNIIIFKIKSFDKNGNYSFELK